MNSSHPHEACAHSAERVVRPRRIRARLRRQSAIPANPSVPTAKEPLHRRPAVPIAPKEWSYRGETVPDCIEMIVAPGRNNPRLQRHHRVQGRNSRRRFRHPTPPTQCPTVSATSVWSQSATRDRSDAIAHCRRGALELHEADHPSSPEHTTTPHVKCRHPTETVADCKAEVADNAGGVEALFPTQQTIRSLHHRHLFRRRRLATRRDRCRLPASGVWRRASTRVPAPCEAAVHHGTRRIRARHAEFLVQPNLCTLVLSRRSRPSTPTALRVIPAV